MDTTQLEQHKLMCVEAFKKGNHDEALRLIPSLQQPATVRTNYYIVYECTNVSLLHLAALHGWMYIVVSLVWEYDCSSQNCDSRGHTPLHYAAVSGGSLPVVQYLITEQNCDPLQCSNDGNNSFMYACQYGHLDVVKYFVTELGIDPTMPNSDGNMPLHVACLSGQVEVVRYLMTSQKFDINRRGKGGYTPLHCACQIGNMSLVKYLITELGCDLELPDKDENLPLHIACLNGQFDVVKYLLLDQKCDLNSRGKEGGPPLHFAIESGNMSLVKYLITELGCLPATPDNDGDMEIHVACMLGKSDILKYLVEEKNCDPHTRGQKGLTPLHYACLTNRIDVVQYLITEQGCDPMSQDNYGSMPIHIACFAGQFNVLKYLITECKCDPGSHGKNGSTPIHCACQNGHMDIIHYLITEQGCDPMSQDNYGSMPIHIACFAGQFNVLKYLITECKCDPGSQGQNCSTPIHCACQNGHMDIIHYLITEQGCDPLSQDNDGNMPIHVACLAGQFAVLKYLVIKHKCDPHCLATILLKLPSHMKTVIDSFYHESFNQAWIEEHKQLDTDWIHKVQDLTKFLTADRCHLNASGTLLHLACQSGSIDIMQYLIKGLGFDPASPDNIGNKPIHIACCSGHLKAVKYIINEANCDAQSRGLLGSTPLHCACEIGHMDIVKYLITEVSCDPATPDNADNKPIHIASTSGHLSIVKCLITKHNCNPSSQGMQGLTPLHFACATGHMDIIQYLINKEGCDPAVKDNKGNMPLHTASCFGQLKVMKYLIGERKCDVHSRGARGKTPLHYACAEGHMDIVQYLINELGCDPAVTNNVGNMPLHFASIGGHLSIVKYLIIEHNCHPNSKGYEGVTPLNIACDSGHMDIIQYLINEVGCDPVANNDGDMPIHIASFNGKLNVLKYLIGKRKGGVCSRGARGNTPLHYACVKGHMDIIQYLTTEIGCDLLLQDNNGSTALHIACLAGQFRVFQYLITKQKCDPNSLATICLKMPLLLKIVMDKFCLMLENIDHLASWIHRNFQIKFNVDDWLCKLQDLSQLLTTDHGYVKVSLTLLHLACRSGSRDLIQYLFEELGCDPKLPDSTGDKPIHYACRSGHLDAVVYLITEAKCSPHSPGFFGITPLHYALESGNMDIIEYLIAEQGCDPGSQDDFSNKPIHAACLTGHLSVVKYLVTTCKHQCDPCCQGCQGATPLHFACVNGHMDIIQYLITELGCDPMSSDYVGSVPLHSACFGGQLDVVKYLVTERKCNPYCTMHDGTTPLHVACGHGHIDIMKYFINELHCNLNIKDNNDQTPLHLACYSGHTQIVRHLLQYGDVNSLMSANDFGHTPVDYAELNDNSFELWKLFQSLLKSKNDYPIHTYTKAVLTGNSAAGKSSLVQIIAKQATTCSHILLTSKNEVEVKTLTAGIECHVIKSKKVGNLVLYDLAGQSEYYFSQSVIMETVMQRIPAIFINLVDLSKSEDEIAQAIHYWLTFIENAKDNLSTSCIMMVGSHIDLLTDEDQIESKCTLVKELVERRVKKLKYLGFVGMDCHKFSADGNAKFFPLFSKCLNAVSSCAPTVSVYCHMLYAFLQRNMDKVACQLQDIVSPLAADEESPISLEVPLLSKLLEDLSDEGLIIYLKNEQYIKRSWVVMKREAILKDVNGVLFAPKYFRGHHPIASSTGIIRMSSLHEPFPKYDVEMLVELMTCLEFCKPVNLSGIDTNLQPLDSTSIEDETDCLLFFPSLLHAERPKSSASEAEQPCSQQLSFGWCLGCTEYEYQFLTTRFLHVLLLRLAYTFSKSCKSYSKTHSLSGIERRCTVWTNGISWSNDDGIRTVVEVIQQSRWVVVAMFPDKDTRPVEYSRHRSAVIKLVLNLQQELAPDLDTFECLISPSLLQQWPLDHLPETDLFSIEDVATSVLFRKPVILSQDDSQKLRTCDAVFFEPYHLLSPSSVCELMDSSKNDQLVSPALLNEVRECCQQPQLQSQSHFSLREHLDKMSIYAGRNPLVVAELDSDTVISRQPLLLSAATTTAQQPVEQSSSPGGPSPHVPSPHVPSLEAPAVSSVDLSGIPDGTLDINSHLPLLMVALTNVAYQWEHLGIQLGLKYGKLKEIKKTEIGIQMDCMREMLAEWLQGSGGECSKQALKTALQKIGCSF